MTSTFSNDEPADAVDTEKHRIIVTELERGWWILAASAPHATLIRSS